ncbi:MAG: hypothetical protein Ct9H300mP18_13380 [Candidatus Neomarinimicrobiota bacterium]|nr:MAG: hypothetical protein Ct9H300mP18_13380 [Candidatus Neomarinimicrobiota bacterium]
MDPDADRLAVVMKKVSLWEKNIPWSQQPKVILDKKNLKRDFCNNLSTPLPLEKWLSDMIASRAYAVGEINVVKKMLEIGSELGGKAMVGIFKRSSFRQRFPRWSCNGIK